MFIHHYVVYFNHLKSSLRFIRTILTSAHLLSSCTHINHNPTRINILFQLFISIRTKFYIHILILAHAT